MIAGCRSRSGDLARGIHPAVLDRGLGTALSVLAETSAVPVGLHISLSEQEDGRLLMTVTDDGTGGAHLSAGGGLAGLLERVQTVDGNLSVDSPQGGPTVVTIDLPGHA